jgi:hypothetical protein
MAICEECPIATAYEISAEKVEQSSTHKEKDKALGIISLNQQLLRSTSERISCPNPQFDKDGHLTCPLEGSVGISRQLIVGRTNPAGLAVELNEFSEPSGNNKRPTTGQYL